MTNTSMFAIAVPAALAAAASIGFASAAQARATKQVHHFKTLDPGLLRDLRHRRMWLTGMVATAAGVGLQMFALAFAPLLVVQPLLVTALVFGAVFSARLRHRPIDRVIIAGSLICTGGLSIFLLVARPQGGTGALPGIWHLLPLAAALAALAGAGLAAGALVGGSVGVLGLALATGVFYGVTAGLLKVVASEIRSSIVEPLQHWTVYAVCIVGPIGFLLSQNTFQRGRLIAPALSMITATDPLVGVAIGVLWLGESAVGSPAALFGETIAAIAIVIGIILLTTRAAHLPEERAYDGDNQTPSRNAI